MTGEDTLGTLDAIPLQHGLGKRRPVRIIRMKNHIDGIKSLSGLAEAGGRLLSETPHPRDVFNAALLKFLNKKINKNLLKYTTTDNDMMIIKNIGMQILVNTGRIKKGLNVTYRNLE